MGGSWVVGEKIQELFDFQVFLKEGKKLNKTFAQRKKRKFLNANLGYMECIALEIIFI